jgi:hypothetical protein
LESNLTGWNAALVEKGELERDLLQQAEMQRQAFAAFRCEFLNPLVAAALEAERGAAVAIGTTGVCDQAASINDNGAMAAGQKPVRKLTSPSALQSPVRPGRHVSPDRQRRGISCIGPSVTTSSDTISISDSASGSIPAGTPAEEQAAAATGASPGSPTGSTPASASGSVHLSGSNNTSAMSHSIRLDYSQPALTPGAQTEQQQQTEEVEEGKMDEEVQEQGQQQESETQRQSSMPTVAATRNLEETATALVAEEKSVLDDAVAGEEEEDEEEEEAVLPSSAAEEQGATLEAAEEPPLDSASSPVASSMSKRAFTEMETGGELDSSGHSQRQGDAAATDCEREKRARVGTVEKENCKNTCSKPLLSPTCYSQTDAKPSQSQTQSQRDVSSSLNCTIALSQLLPKPSDATQMNVDEVEEGFINGREQLEMDEEDEEEAEFIPLSEEEQRAQLLELVTKNNRLLQDHSQLQLHRDEESCVMDKVGDIFQATPSTFNEHV